MVKILVALWVAVVAVRVVLAELVAVVLVASAVGMWAGVPGALVVVGVALLLKAFEWDLTDGDGS